MSNLSCRLRLVVIMIIIHQCDLKLSILLWMQKTHYVSIPLYLHDLGPSRYSLFGEMITHYTRIANVLCNKYQKISSPLILQLSDGDGYDDDDDDQKKKASVP